VLEVGAAAAALDICERHPGTIHLIITDIVMPGMNGPKLAKALLSRRQNLKVLFMSGCTDDSLIRIKLDDGAHILRKPFSPVTLAEKVRQVLDRGISILPGHPRPVLTV